MEIFRPSAINQSMITRRDIIGSAALTLGSLRTGQEKELYGEPIVLSKVAKGRTFVDETALVQDAIDIAIATQRPLVIDIAARVSSLRIRKANGLFIWQCAPLVGFRKGDFEALVQIEDSSDISWSGRLWLSCQWNSGYGACVSFQAQAGRITGNISIPDWSITGARTAFQFGRKSAELGAISEISIGSGFSYGCPNVVRAWGTETVVAFNGANLVANHLGGTTDWTRLASDAVVVAGSHLSIMGGEVQHNASAEGAAFVLEPSPTRLQASYGSIVVMGVQIESAGPLLITRDAIDVTIERDSGHAFFEGCTGYHSQRAFPFISTSKQFGGRVRIGDGCFFRAGGQRVAPIFSNLGGAVIHTPEHAFNRMFHPADK